MPITAISYAIVFISGIVSGIAIDACWLVYLYIIHYFFYPENRWWYSHFPGIFTSQIISITLIVSFLCRYKRYSKSKIFFPPQTKWLYGLFALMCLTSLYSVLPEIHYEFLLYEFKLLIIVTISYKVIDSSKKFEIMIAFYLLGIFYLGWEAYSYGRIMGNRLEGIGMVDATDANDIAAAMITAIPFLIFYFIKGNWWQQGAALCAFAFIANGIILLNSRGAFLGLVFGCCYMIVQLFLKKNLQLVEKRKVAIGIFISFVLFGYLADATFWDRMFTIDEVGKQVMDGESIERTYYWMKTFELVESYPLGTGVSGYTFLSPTFLPDYMLTRGYRAVHSTYFQVLAEYGYLGIVVFFGILSSSYRGMKKVKKYLYNNNDSRLFCLAVTIESSLLCYLIACVFIDRLYSVVMHFEILFSAMLYNIVMLKQINT